MIQEPQHPLNGIWYVYRYNFSRHVLKYPETELSIYCLDEDTCRAEFQLSGFDDVVEVFLDKAGTGKAGAGTYGDVVSTSGAWFGDFEHFDFRWDLHRDQPGILTGYAADRLHRESRDNFVAVRKPRRAELAQRDTYEFKNLYQTPVARTRFSSKRSGDFSIAPAADSFKIDGVDYHIVNEESYHLGRMFTIEANDLGVRLGIWVLPIDESDASESLLAVGDMCHDPNKSVSDSVPSNPQCCYILHLR